MSAMSAMSASECRYDADHLLGISSQVVYNTIAGGISGSASSNVARRLYCAWATFRFEGVLICLPECPSSHSLGEYVRGGAHTNTIEGYFSILKRGINGTYHHVSQQHLRRYLAEFDFRYNERSALGVDDKSRAEKMLK